MKIEHIAIWVKDLETTKQFYTKYFDMECSEKYVNPKKSFSSYFLSFKNAKTRIEIMHNPKVYECIVERGYEMGLTHFSISVGSKEKVDEMTERFRADAYTIKGEPRTTGDGYYESVVLDPEGNNIEVTE